MYVFMSCGMPLCLISLRQCLSLNLELGWLPPVIPLSSSLSVLLCVGAGDLNSGLMIL